MRLRGAATGIRGSGAVDGSFLATLIASQQSIPSRNLSRGAGLFPPGLFRGIHTKTDTYNNMHTCVCVCVCVRVGVSVCHTTLTKRQTMAESVRVYSRRLIDADQATPFQPPGFPIRNPKRSPIPGFSSESRVIFKQPDRRKNPPKNPAKESQKHCKRIETLSAAAHKRW